MNPPPEQDTALPDCAALLMAAGGGERFGSQTPKQFQELQGRMLFEHALQTLCDSDCITSVVVVVAAPWKEKIERHLRKTDAFAKVDRVVEGGTRREDSVWRGLQALPASEYVLVHDAARPWVTEAAIVETLRAAQRVGAATIASRVSDTLVRAASLDSTSIANTVDRQDLWAVQTPQVFRQEILIQAHAEWRQQRAGATDDSGVVLAAGQPVELVPGSRWNLKVTHREDWQVAERLSPGDRPSRLRIGQGEDVHAVHADRKLILGGVEIPWDKGGLEGHSDADVLSHAVANALLGSLALGDLGTHFPDDDPQFKGVSSLELLRHVQQLVQARGYKVSNCDSTIMAQEPRLREHIAPMRLNIAAALNISQDSVSIKATTAEKLGPLGRSEGIAAQAIVLVEEISVGEQHSQAEL